MSATKTKTFVSCAKPVKWRAVKTFFQLCTVANNTNQLFPRRVHCNKHSDGVLSLSAHMYKWVDTKYIPARQTNMYTNACAHTQTHTHTHSTPENCTHFPVQSHLLFWARHQPEAPWLCDPHCGSQSWCPCTPGGCQQVEASWQALPLYQPARHRNLSHLSLQNTVV